MLKNKRVLIGVEPSYQGAVALTGADHAVLIEEPQWSHANARMIARKSADSMNPLQAGFGGTLMTLAGLVRLRGAGAAYSATVLPEGDATLRALGFQSAVDTTPGSEKVTYTLADTGFESVKIEDFVDGKKYTLTGVRANASIAGTSGDDLLVNVTFTGHTVDPVDAALPTCTYDGTEPPPFVGVAMTLDQGLGGEYTPVINNVTFELNNAVNTPANANASDGFGETRITGRGDSGVTGSFDPEDTTVATQDWVGEWKAGTIKTIDVGPVGSTQYNKISIAATDVYYRDVAPGDRDEVLTKTIGFAVKGALTIVFD